MTEAPERLWIWFADREMAQPLHIRQWQSTSFGAGIEFIRADACAEMLAALRAAIEISDRRLDPYLGRTDECQAAAAIARANGGTQT